MRFSTTRSRPKRSSTSFWGAALPADASTAAAYGFAVLALLLALVVAFSSGAYDVSPSDLFSLLWSRLTGATTAVPSVVETVVLQIRGPRIVAAMLVGAALSAAGAAYQSLFRNPLVSPDILGVSSGAALGAVLGIYLSLPVAAIEALAFAGGLVAVFSVYALASAIRGRDPILVLVLGGIVIGALLGSGVSLLKFLADPYNQLPAITFWLLGSLASVDQSDLAVLAIPTVIGLVPLVLLRWRLDVMTLGDEEAAALGVNVRAVRVVVIAAATLMTAAAVSVGGIIGWVGLVMPHLARLAVGPSNARLLPMALLFGAAFLLAVDTVARTLGEVELPLGVLTAAVGTPVFLWLLAFGRRDI
jgi:iron complex transport system permease protein